MNEQGCGLARKGRRGNAATVMKPFRLLFTGNSRKSAAGQAQSCNYDCSFEFRTPSKFKRWSLCTSPVNRCRSCSLKTLEGFHRWFSKFV